MAHIVRSKQFHKVLIVKERRGFGGAFTKMAAIKQLARIIHTVTMPWGRTFRVEGNGFVA